ncbi:MAG: flagellar biosynthesis protein FliQ [Methylomarinum sp.]|nr:flagellar biosynthesis protein FliQ [Methylococcales bacterium]NOR71440.1 flagellar biosynthesis protein FliQ [Methylomarinum sp.]
MTPDVISALAQETVVVSIKLVAPVLLSSLAVGVIISMFQAATQINEQTLTFIPKLLTIIVVLMIAGPWMLQVIIDYFQNLMHKIPELIG